MRRTFSSAAKPPKAEPGGGCSCGGGDAFTFAYGALMGATLMSLGMLFGGGK
jgi:hypothetical protein